ncbi:YebC/PmpR family DNA-binding transcriptional regulator, partial [Klebsiella pneumoniae]
KEITIAARNGADTATNAHLRLVVEQAKKASTPKETLERAIKKGAGVVKLPSWISRMKKARSLLRLVVVLLRATSTRSKKPVSKSWKYL